ncbi:zinc finger MYM-type protein 1-like, partial [Aphis craccivora]
KEKEVVDIDFENNEYPEDVVESVASLPYGHYLKKNASGQFVKRTWVSYSPSTDRKHLACAFKKHEATPDHLQSEIRRAMYINNQRVDLQSFQGLNSKVAENREFVKEIIKTLLFLSRQNMALRGHNESKSSKNQGNFLELIKLLSTNNPLLSSNLLKIGNTKGKNRLTFLSNVSQNKILNILGEMVHGQILQKIKTSGVYSFIIDITTDVANLEQFSLFERFLNEDGNVEER